MVRNRKPTSPGSRAYSAASFEEVTKSAPERSLVVSLRNTLEETSKVESQQDTRVVEIEENTELLILEEIKMVFLQGLLQLNTIQTDQHILHF